MRAGAASLGAPVAAALVQRGMLRLPPPPLPAAAASAPGAAAPAAVRPAPSLLLLPGLTARPWWPASAQPAWAGWLAPLAAAAADGTLAREQAALAGAAAATAGSDYALRADEHTLHRGAWAWQSLLARGALQPAAAVLAPVTTAALARIPGLMTGVPFAYAFFSRMGAGTAIAPHFGPTNLRLRVHVPVRVPAGGAAVAGLRVAGETRGYEHGALIFDDSFEHEAWNHHSEEERTVLLFDIWHPELGPDDIEAIKRMFGEARAKGWLK